LAGTIEDTGGWGSYSTDRVGQVRLGSGANILRLSIAKKPHDWVMNFNQIILTPAK
jgi:hypothetical protein